MPHATPTLLDSTTTSCALALINPRPTRAAVMYEQMARVDIMLSIILSIIIASTMCHTTIAVGFPLA